MFKKKFTCDNKVNETSFMYNFEHILIYIMGKFHVATTFHFDFSPESQPLKCRFVSTFGPEILPKCFRCLA